jgi:hypothetical protein
MDNRCPNVHSNDKLILLQNIQHQIINILILTAYLSIGFIRHYKSTVTFMFPPSRRTTTCFIWSLWFFRVLTSSYLFHLHFEFFNLFNQIISKLFKFFVLNQVFLNLFLFKTLFWFFFFHLLSFFYFEYYLASWVKIKC